jgi:hypothetical protein
MCANISTKSTDFLRLKDTIRYRHNPGLVVGERYIGGFVLCLKKQRVKDWDVFGDSTENGLETDLRRNGPKRRRIMIRCSSHASEERIWHRLFANGLVFVNVYLLLSSSPRYPI